MNATLRFLHSAPTPGEALVWLAARRANDTGESIEAAIDGVLGEARANALAVLDRANAELDRQEALAAKRKRRAS